MTIWPRFYGSSNDQGNQAEAKDITTLGPAPSTELRDGSHRGRQIGWGTHTCNVLPGCIKTHSKTPIIIHMAF